MKLKIESSVLAARTNSPFVPNPSPLPQTFLRSSFKSAVDTFDTVPYLSDSRDANELKKLTQFPATAQ